MHGAGGKPMATMHGRDHGGQATARTTYGASSPELCRVVRALFVDIRVVSRFEMFTFIASQPIQECDVDLYQLRAFFFLNV